MWVLGAEPGSSWEMQLLLATKPFLQTSPDLYLLVYWNKLPTLEKPKIHFAAQADSKLMVILMLWPPWCWNCKIESTTTA